MLSGPGRPIPSRNGPAMPGRSLERRSLRFYRAVAPSTARSCPLESPVAVSPGRILALPPADREPSLFAAARRGEYAGMFRTTLAGHALRTGTVRGPGGSIEMGPYRRQGCRLPGVSAQTLQPSLAARQRIAKALAGDPAPPGRLRGAEEKKKSYLRSW